ncbi:MAG: HAMP domain-containing protein [Burkholderiales bacterium]|nr:HAMP domain-containing protein [Burkholderiales bacterium]
MTLWPKSLVGRNALLLVGLILLAQLVSGLLIRELIIKPRVDQIADSVARNITAIRAGLQALPEADRAAFLDAFRQAGRDPTRDAEDAGEEPRGLMTLERLFVRSVSARLAANDTEVIWRRDGRSLALHLRIDGRGYWLPLPDVLPTREQTGAWLVASLASALLALLGALAIQRRIQRPLGALVDATAALGRGKRPPPLGEDGPTEIATVSRSFNELVRSLEAIERERALMLAGVSHDLRTPLTKLRLGVEILAGESDPGIAASLHRSVAEMDAVIGQFLDFARVDDSAVPTESLTMASLARDIAASFADQGHALEVDAGPGPAVSMRAALVRRAAVNLVENALRHGRPPVRLATGSDAASVWFEVTDAGAGIPAAEIEAVKQPFRRTGAARSGAPGAGLGLAIVERVARTHGGSLELAAAEPHGLRARLRLPKHPPA